MFWLRNKKINCLVRKGHLICAHVCLKSDLMHMSSDPISWPLLAFFQIITKANIDAASYYDAVMTAIAVLVLPIGKPNTIRT